MSDTEQQQQEQEDYQQTTSATHHTNMEDEEYKLESSQGTTGEFEFDPQVVTASIEDDDYLSQQQREIGEQLDTQGDEFEDESGAVIIPSSPRGAPKDGLGISVSEGSSIAMEMLTIQVKEKQAQVVAGINNTKFS